MQPLRQPAHFPSSIASQLRIVIDLVRSDTRSSAWRIPAGQSQIALLLPESLQLLYPDRQQRIWSSATVPCASLSQLRLKLFSSPEFRAHRPSRWSPGEVD